MSDKTFSQVLNFTRASTGTYFDSAGVLQTAAVDEPRFTHDTDTLAPQGLLVEEQRTRLNTIAAAPTAPENVTVSAVVHTISFFGTGTVDLTGVATETLIGTGADDRVTLTFTPSAGTLTITPSGTVQNLQLEAGSFETSVILGEGSQVTRSADNCSRTLGSEFNASEGTFFIDIVPTGDPNKNTALVGSNDNNLNPIFYAQTTDNFIVDFRAIDAGALYSMQPAVQASAFSRSKIAVSYGTSGTKMAVNGAIGIDESLPINISAMSSCKILTRDDGTVFNAECEQLKYFPRALSDAELIALTTPES